MQIQDMTPRQIDEALSELHAELAQARAGVAAAETQLHHALGERRRHAQWPNTNAQAIVKLIELVAAADYQEPPAHSWRCSPAAALAGLDAARERVADVHRRIAPYDAEFTRRGGWARFFTVTGGHIHASLNCQTCHRNGKVTEMGWTPQLSGRTEGQAMAELGAHAFVLCTVCFPNAPLEWTAKPVKPACPGAHKAPAADTRRRYARNTYGQCTGCGEMFRLNMAGEVIRHAPAREHAHSA